MKKSFKRTAAFVLALTLVAGCAPVTNSVRIFDRIAVTASAAAYDENSDGIEEGIILNAGDTVNTVRSGSATEMTFEKAYSYSYNNGNDPITTGTTQNSFSVESVTVATNNDLLLVNGQITYRLASTGKLWKIQLVTIQENVKAFRISTPLIGSGTADNPYKIGSADDLQCYLDNCDTTYSGADTNGKTYLKLTNSLFKSDDNDQSYNGSINVNKDTVLDLNGFHFHINGSATDSVNTPLTINKATLTIEDKSINQRGVLLLIAPNMPGGATAIAKTQGGCLELLSGCVQASGGKDTSNNNVATCPLKCNLKMSGGSLYLIGEPKIDGFLLSVGMKVEITGGTLNFDPSAYQVEYDSQTYNYNFVPVGYQAAKKRYPNNNLIDYWIVTSIFKTVPTIIEDFTYDGNTHALLQKVGALADGTDGTIQYHVDNYPLGEIYTDNGGDQRIDVNKLKVGDIIKPGSVAFPDNVDLVYVADEYNRYTWAAPVRLLSGSNSFSVSYGTGGTNSGTSLFDYRSDGNNDPDDGDSIRITNIIKNDQDVITAIECTICDTATYCEWIEENEQGDRNIKATNAGDYYVYSRVMNGQTEVVPPSLIGKVTIAKADLNVADANKPTANNRTYDGTEKPLVNAPTNLPTGVTVQYVTVIEQDSRDIIPIEDLSAYKVGDILKPTGTYGFNFPKEVGIQLIRDDGSISDISYNDNQSYGSVIRYNNSQKRVIVMGKNILNSKNKNDWDKGYDAVKIIQLNLTGDQKYIEVEICKSSEIGSITGSETIPTSIGAGDYKVYYKIEGDENHNDYVPENPLSVTIAPITATVSSEPTANTLTYTGEAQTLITEGTATNGSMKYKITKDSVTTAPTKDWEDSLTNIKGTDVGTYRVWYKAVGLAADTNHADSAAAYVDVTISAATNSFTTAPTLVSNPKYRGTAIQLITSAGEPKFGEATDVHYLVTTTDTEPKLSANWREYDDDTLKANAVGTYYVWYQISAGTDWNAVAPTKLGSVTVSQYTPPSPSYYSQTWKMTMESYEYDGSAHTPVIDGKMYGAVTYTYYDSNGNKLDSAPKEVGNYKVEVYAEGGSTHYSRTQTAEYSITAKPAPTSYTVTVKNGTINGKTTGTYEPNKVLVAKADNAPAGYKFAYWKKNGATASYSESYTFPLSRDIELEAVYTLIADEFQKDGTGQLEGFTADKENGKLTIAIMHSVLQDCKILKAGLVATSNTAKLNNLTAETADFVRYKDNITVHNYKYTWTKNNVTPDQTWYIRSYLVYQDAEGNVKTVYGDMIQATLDGYKVQVENKIVGASNMDDVIVDKANRKISFAALMSVPVDCTVKFAGAVATSDASKKNYLTKIKATEKTMVNGCYVRGMSSKMHTVKYTWTKTEVTEDQTWYVRSYLVYVDSHGNEQIVYGDLTTAKLN